MQESISNRIEALVREFDQFDDWEDRYKHLIQMGKDLEEFPQDFKTDKNLIKGCQSRAWLHAEMKDGRIYYYGESEAAIVKGILAIILKAYSGGTLDEVLSAKPTFLETIGLREHLSMSRSNGLSSVLKLISTYAIVFKNMEY